MRKKNLLSFLLPAVLLVVIIVGLCVRTVKFAQLPYYDWDESIYIQVAQGIAETGDLRLQYNQDAWLEKPPLYFALLAFSMTVFGESEFNQRLVNVFLAGIAGVLLIMISYRLVNWLFRKDIQKLSPLVMNILLAVPLAVYFTVPAVVTRSTLISVDILLTVGWLGFIAFSQNIWLQMLFLQIGIQAKSIIGFAPLIIESGRLLLPVRELGKQVGYFALLIGSGLIWYIIMFGFYGQDFITVHLFEHIISRVQEPIELKFGGRIFYFRELWNELGVFLILIAVSYLIFGIDQIRKWVENRKRLLTYIHEHNEYYRGALVLVLPVAILMAFTASQTKIGWYLMPLYPFLALALLYPLVLLATRFPRVSSLIALCIIVFAMYRFTNVTFLLQKPVDDTRLVETAKCISQLQGKRIAVLANEQERLNRSVMEAAGINISTSFDYGGMPRFLYYSNKNVAFYYKTDTFEASSKDYDIVMVTQKDYLLLKTVDELGANRVQRCNNDAWLVLERKK